MKLSTIVFAALASTLPCSALVVKKRQMPTQAYNIHPNGDTAKCVGVSGGVLAVGSAVTM